jgi:hypothetical protein
MKLGWKSHFKHTTEGKRMAFQTDFKFQKELLSR